VEEEVPGNGGWDKDGEAEEPARVAGESAADRKGTRRSEKAKVSEEALLTRSSKAKKPMTACVHTYTRSQTSSTRRRGPGWRIHGIVEDTKLSTNKQHSLPFDPALWETFVSTTLGLEVPILATLPRLHNSRHRCCCKNLSSAWTFTATTRARAQLTQVQPRRTTRCSARPDTSCAHSTESRQAQANGAAMWRFGAI